jgi:hypothetical protein
MMRRIIQLVLVLIVAASYAFAEPVELEIFVIDPCGGCTGKVGIGCRNCSIIDEMSIRYRDLFREDGVSLKFYNLRMDNTWYQVFRDRIASLGVNPEDVPLPVVFIDNEPFLADGSMDEMIINYLKTGESPGIETLLLEKAEYEASRIPGRVVYLYSSYCEDCQDISRWLTYSLPIGYEVVKYDIYTATGQAMEKYYIEQLGIPENEYCVPLIVYGNYWFAGMNDIYLSLKSRIQEYPDIQTTILEEIM